MRERIAKAAPYLTLAAVLCLLIFLNIFCHDNWLDSDMAAEMMFSKLLAEEGRLFATPDWYYSTEFRLLYTHWIMGPLFRFVQDWHVIRTVTNLLSYGLVLCSYYFFMRPLKVKRGLVVLSSAILLLPFSETMMTHMVMGNTYMFHVVIVFFFFGLYLRLAGTAGGWRSKTERVSVQRMVWLLCYLALAVVCGVSGVRYLLALQCPLVVTSFLFLLKSAEFQGFRKKLIRGRFKAQSKSLWGCNSMKYLIYSLLGAVGSVVGYGVNVLYVSRKFVFQTYDATNFIPVYQGVLWERLQNAIGCLLMLFGYIPERSVLSLRGVVTMAAFVILAVMVYCSVKAYRGNGGQRLLVSLFLLVSFGLNMFVFVFTTSTMVPRYYITILIFALPMLCFYLEKEELYFDRLVVGVLLSACLLLATGKTVMSYMTVDKNESRRPVAEFLLQNGYTFGYATYWNANIITELTDGGVELANVGDGRDLEYFKWSSPMKYYQNGYHKGEVFLLLTLQEADECADAETLRQGEIRYQDDAYIVYVYESSERLLRLAGH
ncbi:MAG: hypothetical protein NC092_11000 [Butyrivibrio sp.]|nr:hypothetical protein [Muribaculum sp.]MCM1553208.1 hypothetical protein [Butyrivibrio sp.]